MSDNGIDFYQLKHFMSFPKHRFILSVLQFLEKEYKDVSNEAVFQKLLKTVMKTYEVDYLKEKSSIMPMENIVTVLEDYGYNMSTTLSRRKVFINKLYNFFTKEFMWTDKLKSIEDVMLCVVEVTGAGYKPMNSCLSIKNLFDLFREDQGEIFNAAGCTVISYNAKRAIKSFTLALEYQPENSTFLCNRAEAYLIEGYHIGVIDDAIKALYINPYTRANDYVGVLCIKEKLYLEAFDIYLELMMHDPDNAMHEERLREILEYDFNMLASTIDWDIHLEVYGPSIMPNNANFSNV